MVGLVKGLIVIGKNCSDSFMEELKKAMKNVSDNGALVIEANEKGIFPMILSEEETIAFFKGNNEEKTVLPFSKKAV